MKPKEAAAYLARVQPALVAVAAPLRGVCWERCRSGAEPGKTICGQCLRHGVPTVLPISMSEDRSGLHRRLRRYKDADDSEERREHCLHLAALLGLFLRRHQPCLGPMYDFVATVPSANRDAFATVVDMVKRLSKRRLAALRATGTSSEPRFELVAPEVGGKVVLLLDDTFTSGKSIAAAHSVLANGGAKVLGPVVIGRHFRPDYWTSADIWNCLKKHKWSLHSCGLCEPVNCQTALSPQTLF